MSKGWSIRRSTNDGGAHRAEDRMIVRFPADITPAYFADTVKYDWVATPADQAANDWLLTGDRVALVHMANLAADLTG